MLLNTLIKNNLLPRNANRWYSAATRQHIRNPTRGGQNLSNRYARLELSLRGKTALESQKEEFERSTLAGPATTASSTTNVQTFRGIVVPMKPREPASDECCMSGCAVCVYDLYEESLTAYKDSVAKVKATLTSMGVPEQEWPGTLREAGNGNRTTRKADVTLSAFEEMERRLEAKRLGASSS
ncbi:hypothetical protein V5O48_017308 [Marasmius crinis-equi]|uniref:Oxidoreductase-like domain-containing protein n=1 Tax=Marasmius crinis-equi TaxID=585013 RepID=A0ABR3EPB4_9AGAR